MVCNRFLKVKEVLRKIVGFLESLISLDFLHHQGLPITYFIDFLIYIVFIYGKGHMYSWPSVEPFTYKKVGIYW